MREKQPTGSVYDRCPYANNPILPEGLDLVEANEQITIQLDEELDVLFFSFVISRSRLKF
jgi:hypothetical protein